MSEIEHNEYQPMPDEWKFLWIEFKNTGIDIPERIRVLINRDERFDEIRKNHNREESKKEKHDISEYHREQYYKKNGWIFTPREFKK